MNKSNKIHIVYGPTASGKTDHAIALARDFDSVIINGDAMQIFKEIPIITNQPAIEEMQGIPHRMFGYKSILESSDMQKWLDDAVPLIKDIQREGKTPIVVGGTGMYLKALMKGLSPIPDIPVEKKEEVRKKFSKLGNIKFHEELKKKDKIAGERLNTGDSQRLMRAYEVIDFTGKPISEWNKMPHEKFFMEEDFEVHFLDRPREEVYAKINTRFEKFIELGALEEAEKANEIFENSGLTQLQIEALSAYKAHGLRELIAYSKGEISLEKAIEQGQQVTRNYAKRQITWWKGQMNG